jgi:hypothetical protein
MVIPPLDYAVTQTPVKALEIKHFRAGRKNECKEETGRQELAETGYPFRDTAARKADQ